MNNIKQVTIYNTPQRKKVTLIPYEKGKIKMYSCGPTVYNTVHIGNLRSLVNFDVVSRALRYLGYDLKRVVNFTDVGHMSSDSDFGEDKVERQAVKEETDPISIANKYISHVLESFRKLNVLNPNGTPIEKDINVPNMTKELWTQLGWARATDYIQEMIDFIKRIEANGHTYETEQAVYFDVSTFPQYYEFFGQSLEEKQVAVREEVKEDSDKRNPADFVLWMKRYGKYKNHMMHWNSPWGDGFPGWHIECSTMSCKLLGEYIDIHTGGSDLISVHHPNEVAQNWGAYGHHVIKYWIHNEFVYTSKGDKLSKSKNNAFTLEEIEELGIPYMALRWYYLTSNYRTPMKFSIDSLKSSQSAYENSVNRLAKEYTGKVGKPSDEYIQKFKDALSDNFNTPVVLALLNDLVKSDISPEVKIATAIEFDKVLGLDLEKSIKQGFKEIEIPYEKVKDEKIKKILKEREVARKNKEWEKSDKLRDTLSKMGYKVIDKESGQYIVKE